MIEENQQQKDMQYFYFVSKYSVGHAIFSGNKMAIGRMSPPIFVRPDKCPSSKWCHERNSVRYPERMLIEENSRPFLLFLVLPTRDCIQRERAGADYNHTLSHSRPQNPDSTPTPTKADLRPTRMFPNYLEMEQLIGKRQSMRKGE